MTISQRRTLERHLHERHVPESDHLDLSWLWQTVRRVSVAIALISVAVLVVRVW